MMDSEESRRREADYKLEDEIKAHPLYKDDGWFAFGTTLLVIGPHHSQMDKILDLLEKQ